MTRIWSYILFVVSFFILAKLLSFEEGYVSNSISACASTVILYCVHRRVRLLEGLILLLIVTVVIPASILLLIGGNNIGQTIEMLAKNISSLSALQFFLPSILGGITLIILNVFAHSSLRRKERT